MDRQQQSDFRRAKIKSQPYRRRQQPDGRWRPVIRQMTKYANGLQGCVTQGVCRASHRRLFIQAMARESPGKSRDRD